MSQVLSVVVLFWFLYLVALFASSGSSTADAHLQSRIHLALYSSGPLLSRAYDCSGGTGYVAI